MTSWTRRRFLGTAGAAVLGGGVLAACSGDDDAPTAASVPATTTTSSPTPLPTNDEDELTRLFDPLFEPLDQHVTRIGLYDLSQGFVRSDDGTHLAIYVEPVDPAGEGWDASRYVDTIAPNAQACLPFIFDTWPGIQSMDVCQEPPQDDAPEPEPPIVTQVQLFRSDYADLDVENLTLAALFAQKEASPATVRLAANEDVRAEPAWQDAGGDDSPFG